MRSERTLIKLGRYPVVSVPLAEMSVHTFPSKTIRWSPSFKVLKLNPTPYVMLSCDPINRKNTSNGYPERLSVIRENKKSKHLSFWEI